MSRVDVGPALAFMKTRLGLSNEVMADLLPGFVVDQIMTNENVAEATELEAERFASPRNTFAQLPIPDIVRHADSSRVSHRHESRTPRFINLSNLNHTNQYYSSSPPTSGPLGHKLNFQRHDSVTIFFSDIVGFSTWSHHRDPEDVMATLDDLFSRLDTIIMEEMKGLYKIETVGDAYVVAVNLINEDPVHALTAVRFALRAQQEASEVREPGSDKPLQMRIGIHTGPIVAGIVGKIRKRYCCFGDTMNMASRVSQTVSISLPNFLTIQTADRDLMPPW
jgi:hypothetical protein